MPNYMQKAVEQFKLLQIYWQFVTSEYFGQARACLTTLDHDQTVASTNF